MLERFDRFTHNIYEIQRCWNKLASEEMDIYGLKGSYHIYLIVMHRFPDGVTASQLGVLCGRDKADVSRTVAVMESKGLIKKVSGSGNLYRAKLILTEQGAELTEIIVKKAQIAETISGCGIDDEQREIFYSVLERIANNIRELCKTGIPSETAETETLQTK